MAVYKPLFVYLTPASIPQVVAHIQQYLADNPIVSDPEAIAEAIQEYIEAHPEIIAVASVNGKTGNVVLTGSDININASSAVSVETQLQNLASMIQSASGDITQIEAQLETIYTNIGTIETNVSNNTSAISALQTSVEGQGTRIATAESDIDALESAQSAQNTRLNTAEGNISSLQTRMTQAETDIDSNESSIGTLNTTIGTLQNDVNALKNLDDWETGTNYSILPNGLKICFGQTTVTVSQSSTGAYSYIGNVTIQFPFTFNSIPRVFVSPNGNPSTCNAGGYSATTSQFALHAAATSSTTVYVSWFAIGF